MSVHTPVLKSRDFRRIADAYRFYIYKTECEQVETHAHDYIELTYIVHGEGTVTIGNKTRIFGAHDLQVAFPGVAHGFTAKPGTVHRQVSIALTEDIVAYLKPLIDVQEIIDKLRNEEGVMMHAAGDCVSDVENSIDTVYREYQFRQTAFNKIIVLELSKLMITLYRLLTPEHSSALHRFRDVPSVVLRALQFLETEYYRLLGLDDIVRNEGIHKKYFIRLFKKATGFTPIEYLNRLRIEKCCAELASTSFSVTQIALNCGFNDLRHFNRLFRRFLNMAPLEYRKSKPLNTAAANRFTFPQK